MNHLNHSREPEKMDKEEIIESFLSRKSPLTEAEARRLKDEFEPDNVSEYLLNHYQKSGVPELLFEYLSYVDDVKVSTVFKSVVNMVADSSDLAFNTLGLIITYARRRAYELGDPSEAVVAGISYYSPRNVLLLANLCQSRHELREMLKNLTMTIDLSVHARQRFEQPVTDYIRLMSVLQLTQKINMMKRNPCFMITDGFQPLFTTPNLMEAKTRAETLWKSDGFESGMLSVRDISMDPNSERGVLTTTRYVPSQLLNHICLGVYYVVLVHPFNVISKETRLIERSFKTEDLAKAFVSEDEEKYELLRI